MAQERELAALDDRQLDRFFYSLSDFAEAYCALQLLKQSWPPPSDAGLLNHHQLRCFENQMVISFARPFCPGRGGVRFSLKVAGVTYSDRENFLKDKLIDLRNTLIAHSDDEKMAYSARDFSSTSKHSSDPRIQFNIGLRIPPYIWTELEDMLNKIVKGSAPKIDAFAQADPERFARHKNWRKK